MSPSSLTGQRILLTRPAGREDDLFAALETCGARPVCVPTIRVAPPQEMQSVEDAVQALGANASPDWVLFTSVPGVAHFLDLVERKGQSGAMRKIPIAAVGPATAQALRRRGYAVQFVPQDSRGEGLARELAQSETLAGKRILLPRAAQARQDLPRLLREAGARVEDLAVYCILPASESAPHLQREIEQGLDWIVFASGLAAKHFAALAGTAIMSRLRSQEAAPRPVRIASWGPSSSETIREIGLPVHAEAKAASVEGILEALTR